MVLIPLRKQSETGRTEAFGPSPVRKPRFGFENSRKFEFVSRLGKDRSGIAAIEYGYLAALIALGVVAGISNLGTEVGEDWDQVAAAVGADDGGKAKGKGKGKGKGKK